MRSSRPCTRRATANQHSNGVVSAEGRAKVLDFGLARRVPSSVNEAVTNSSGSIPIGALAGTMPYMPPELLLGQPTDERSDIWSFGVMLFEMAMGELPFRGRTEFELTAAILRSPPQPLPAHVPAMIRSVTSAALEGFGASLSRAGEARAALDAIRRTSRSPAPRSIGGAPRAAGWIARCRSYAMRSAPCFIRAAGG